MCVILSVWWVLRDITFKVPYGTDTIDISNEKAIETAVDVIFVLYLLLNTPFTKIVIFWFAERKCNGSFFKFVVSAETDGDIQDRCYCLLHSALHDQCHEDIDDDPLDIDVEVSMMQPLIPLIGVFGHFHF